MKQQLVQTALALCTIVLGAAVAAPAFASDASRDTLMVLVAVNSSGMVTKIDSAERVQPSERHALENTIRRMILAPAKDKDGNTIASQFVMRLVVRDGGDSKTPEFALDGIQPVLTGPMMWVQIGPPSRQRYAVAPYPGRSMVDNGRWIAEARNHRATLQNSGGDGAPSHNQTHAQ